MLFKRYILVLICGSLSGLAAAIGFNWLIDPYAIFGTERIAGLNRAKPFAGDRGRTTKLYQVVDAHPAGLIGGNSRAEMGLDPAHPCWPKAARPVYNMAIPGTSVYEQFRYLQHGAAAGNVRGAVLSVDFLDYLQPPGTGGDPHRWPPRPVGDRAFLVAADGSPAAGVVWPRLKDYAAALLSLDTASHSIATVLRQHGGLVPTRTRLGFNPAENFYRPIVRNEGVGVLFAQKNREVITQLTARKWSLYQGDTKWSADLEALRRLILYARDRNIDLVLFVSPYHAEYLASIDLAGMWPLFEEWKRRLALIARDHGVPLWDFSAFDRYSTEDIDALKKKGESLDWFWEPAHYRKVLGDIVLANIWRSHCPSPETYAHYGKRIDGPDLEAHLSAQRVEKDRYLAGHPAVVHRLRGFLDERRFP